MSKLISYVAETDDGDRIEIDRIEASDDFAIVCHWRGVGAASREADIVEQLVVPREAAAHIAAGLVGLLAERP